MVQGGHQAETNRSRQGANAGGNNPILILTDFSIQMMITVAVNGVAMSSMEIPEVSGTGHLYTAPQLGYPPAVGVTRDVTVIDSDSGEWGNGHNDKQNHPSGRW